MLNSKKNLESTKINIQNNYSDLQLDFEKIDESDH